MFGSFGAGFGAFGSGTGGLLPTITNLTSWIRGATEDGKTLPNSKGTDANLTGVNCIDSDNDDADNITAQLTSSPTGDWYVEMTVYPQTFEFFQELVAINASYQYLRFNGTTGKLAARIANTSYTSTSAIPLNEWSRVVCERSGSNLIYSAYELDGTQRFTETVSAESTAFANDELVFLGVSSGRHFNGLVSDIKVGNSSTDLLCHYPLAEGSGTKAYDVSGKGNHGTITGTSWSTQNSIASWNHQYGHIPSVTFDGTDDYIASGVTANDNFTFEFKAKLSSDGDYMGSLSGGRFFFGRNSTTSVRLGYKTFNGIATVDSTVFDKFTTFKLEGGKLYVDGVETIDSAMSANGQGCGELFIGARNFVGTADNFCDTDLAYAKIWNASGTLVRHFVPTTDGLIDLVNHTAYTNDGTGTLTTKRIPALNAKTTQVVTLDGVNDYVNIGTDVIPANDDFVCDFTFKPLTLGTNYLVSQFNFGSAGRFYVGHTSNGVLKLYMYVSDSEQNLIESSSGSIVAGTKYSIRLKRTSNTFELLFGSDFNNLTSVGTHTTTQGIYQGSANSKPTALGFWSSNMEATEFYDFKLTVDGVVTRQYDFQNNVGTTTVLDTSGNNNGTVVNATLANFWRKRVADTAGSLVSADYAAGNTSISNPSGYTHNNSECGFDMVTNDKTTKELFTINNSTATETFARKNNSFITQVLDYSSALTGDELTRTRTYVGD